MCVTKYALLRDGQYGRVEWKDISLVKFTLGPSHTISVQFLYFLGLFHAILLEEIHMCASQIYTQDVDS